MRWANFLVLMIAGAAATASAARQTSPAEEQLKSVQDCRPIAEASARLACFERASTPAPDLPPSVQTAESATDQSWHPARSTQVRAGSGAVILSNAQLVSLSEGTPGQWRFVLDNGMRWNMTEGRSAIDLPKRGATIAVRHTALGAFLLDWGSGVSVRVAPAS